MESPVPAPASRKFAGRRLVLIVDDDPVMRTLCAISLNISGLVVREAPDGETALARARSECPDLVLTDVKMPGLDGFELAQALRDDVRTRQVPLIFLSGETGKGNRARADELGALAYVTKPFDPSTLASLVEVALSRPGVAAVR
jgi:CheY-like chemotaxis protein